MTVAKIKKPEAQKSVSKTGKLNLKVIKTVYNKLNLKIK